jgi:hypothetical protein
VSAKIPTIRAAPPYLRAVKNATNHIAGIINKGLVVDTDTVIAERLEDGRVRLFLNPVIVAQGAAGAAPGPFPTVLTADYVAGSGYTATDLIIATGGTFTIPFALIIGTVDGSGIPQTWTWNFGYKYTAEPANPVSFTGGSGTGASFNLVWSA